jgi:hypothetical protein
VNPNDPEVAIVNSYQFEKFSLVTHPLQLSDVRPGPELKPLNETIVNLWVDYKKWMEEKSGVDTELEREYQECIAAEI